MKFWVSNDFKMTDIEHFGRRFARRGGSLSPPVACATDRSKAVIWVWFLLHKNVGNSALCSLLLL